LASDRAIYMLSGDLRVLSVNPGALRMWGKAREEVLGRSMTELFPQMRGTEVQRAMESALKSFRPATFETRSFLLDKMIEVELYPLNAGLQVTVREIAS